MGKISREWVDRFYYYNACFDPIELINKYSIDKIEPTRGHLTNSFGVIINSKFFPDLLKNREGDVEGLPIPANWHADISEFGAALRSVDLADTSFTMIELGCGWGCWMNIAGIVAKRRGLKVKLIGVEGDEAHIEFAREALKVNGFESSEFSLYHGIVSNSEGKALFPKQEVGGLSWGLEPILDLSETAARKLYRTGKYNLLEKISIDYIASEHNRIDLLHVDIQGGEKQLVPASILLLSEKVAYLLIGTHSRQIEGVMFDCLLNAGWILEIERPAVLCCDDNIPYVTVDGVQGWRNPKLVPSLVVETNGNLHTINTVSKAKINDTFTVKVKIYNASKTDWESKGSKPVYLSYHWLNQDGSYFIYDGERTTLPQQKICSGQTKEHYIKVIPPSVEGRYQLCLTLVQEGVKWFELPDFTPSTINVFVK